MPEQPKKTLYHSQAVQMGQIHCLVKTGIQKSKYEGKPNYIVLVIDGFDRNLNIDSDAIASALAPLQGRKVMLQFLGGKGSETVKVLGAGQPQGQPPADPKNDGRNEPPPAQQEVEDLKRGRHTMMQLANLLSIALDGAQYVAAAHAKKHPAAPPFTSDNICSLAATLCIGGERQGVQNLMPSHPLDAALKSAGGGK
jgi:hypothetical protein